MKYVISEVTTGDIIKVYHDYEDAFGSDYFYFKHLVDTNKKTYTDNNRVYSITDDNEKVTPL
jgi:hypothetical protein